MSKINFNKESSMIIVNVLLMNENHNRLITMALDTGATYTLVPWDIIESLNIDPFFQTKRIDMITASGIEKVPMVNIPSIKVGNIVTNDVEVILHDLPPKSKINGFLGLNFLKNYNLSVNFKEGYFELLN